MPPLLHPAQQELEVAAAPASIHELQRAGNTAEMTGVMRGVASAVAHVPRHLVGGLQGAGLAAEGAVKIGDPVRVPASGQSSLRCWKLQRGQ